MKKTAVLLLALASAAWGQTPRYEDRLAVQSGLWSQSGREGEGFEIRAIRDEVFIIWFAFDRLGKSTWYVAQGRLNRTGETRFELKKTNYTNSTVTSTVVGSLTLTVANPEDISFSIQGGEFGSVTRRPQLIRATANRAAVDHSGQWFEPLKSGYGIGLNESENAGFLVTFLYDDAGAPIWFFAGRNGEKTEPYTLTRFGGACPTCSPFRPIGREAGTLNLEFPSINELRVTMSGDGVPNQFKRPGAQFFRLSASPDTLLANQTLVAMPNVDALREELIAGILNPFFTVTTVFSAAPPSSFTPAAIGQFSDPNTLLATVDEATTLRTDGNRVYALDIPGNQLRFADYHASSLSLTREAALSPAIQASPGKPLDAPSSGLIRFRNNTIAIRSSQAITDSSSFPLPPDAWKGGRTVVDVVSDDPTIATQRYQLEGYLMAARRVGSKVYLLSRSSVAPAPELWQFERSPDRPARLRTLPIAEFLPAQWINGTKQPALEPARVYLPPKGAQPARPEFSVITEIDLNKALEAPGAVQNTAVLGQVTATYVTEKSMYVATNRYYVGNRFSTYLPNYPVTEIHRFDLTPAGVRFAASGAVAGNISATPEQAGLRFSEKGNELRLVTSSFTVGAEGRNILTVLAPTQLPDLLSTVSTLPNETEPAPIGRPGQQITATRFIGDRLLVNTFLASDPLYVIDLSNSARPKILSALEVPGFSSYLFPLSERHVLGFGYGPSSMELSLFDLSDPTQVRRTEVLDVTGRQALSSLTRNPLAFSYLPTGAGRGRFGFPISSVQFTGWADFTFDETSGTKLRATSRLEAAVSDSSLTAAAFTARGLYLRDIIVYLENGNIWHTTPNGPSRRL
jgi:hypothetical protein